MKKLDKSMLFKKNTFIFDYDGILLMKFMGEVALSDNAINYFFSFLRGTNMIIPKLYFPLNVSHLHHVICIQVIIRVWNILPWLWGKNCCIEWWNESIG